MDAKSCSRSEIDAKNGEVNVGGVDVFRYIISIRGTIYKKSQEEFIRLITVYTKDGVVTDVGITAKRERLKKASRVGLGQERKIVHVDDGVKISVPGQFDISSGRYLLIYSTKDKDIQIFRE